MSRLLRPYFYLILYALLQSIQYGASITINTQSEQYKNKRIICNNNEDCTILCQEPNSCQYAHIECPINHECNITCSASASCQHMTINATYSSLFTLHDCDNGNDYTCSGLSIHFPPNHNGKRRGILHVGKNFNSKSNELEFYAINGWKDIDTTYYATEHETVQGIMHCTPNYDQQCIFASLDGKCANSNDICNNYTSKSSDQQYPPYNAAKQPSEQSQDIISELLHLISTLNQIWYIIGTIVLFLCCFLCILVCLIHRSYDVHREAAKGLRTANDELAAFKSMHEVLVSPYNQSINQANSPYNQSLPISSQLGTPIPKSKPPSSATSIVTMDIQQDHMYDDEKHSMTEHGHHINKAKLTALYPPSHWNPQTPLNSVQTNLYRNPPSMHHNPPSMHHNPPSMHHNPPSIVSVSTTTPNGNELGLQSQQIYKLSMQSRASQHLDPPRLPSPSYRSVTTLNTITSHNTLNTNNTNHTIQTFMVVESVNDEDEDEFIEYQQTPSDIYNKSRTSSRNKKMPSAASSSMPLSVNSPSTSPISTLGDARMPMMHSKPGHIAHIPRFDGSNAIDPLPEAHTAEIRNVSAFDGVLGQRKDTNYSSSNPFQSTANSGSSVSSGSVSNSSSSLSSSSTSSSSYTSSGNSSGSESIEDETMFEHNDAHRMHKNGYKALIVGSQPTEKMTIPTDIIMNDKRNSRAHSL